MTTNVIDPVEQFISDLRNARGIDGMSGYEISKRFEVNRQSVYQWINGEHRPSILVVRALRPILDEILKEQE